ncbi:MAG: winged helix-turn-helix transcriptional regulator [Bacteroidetes bacterium]|nr:winged helix-turn-helix transcriptional regulator [Bacteroidota bacterium]
MAVKVNSTNNINKQEALIKCPVTYTLGKIGGRWKALILFNLIPGKKRYSEIKRGIPNITEKMLIQHLKELEQDQLVLREALPVVPPYVMYSLTRQGKEMKPILEAMAKWGIKNGKEMQRKR